jgi:hypothetical protein
MIYNVSGQAISGAYAKNGSSVDTAFDKSGNVVFGGSADYSSYSVSQKWTPSGIFFSTQGLDIYDGKVFWVTGGNGGVEQNCYVWNLSNGAAAIDPNPFTVYSGHGNNICLDFPKLYASTAYSPNKVYVNTLSGAYTATLTQTLFLTDGSTDLDASLDETDKTILWSLGHTASSSDTSAPYNISKWNLSNLTDNGDGTFSPERLQTVQTPQPACYFFQGFKMHDGILWYASGYTGGSYEAYVYGIDPNTGERLYTIDTGLTSEPEGVAWVADSASKGGYALYIGFGGMQMYKCIFT